MKSRLMLMFIFILLTALGISGQGIGDRNRPSEGGSHVISGKVYMPDGRPAGAGVVKVSYSSSDSFGRTTSTDNDGSFSFSGLPSGNYQITVRADGFQTENESLTIERFASGGQGYQLSFHLRLPGQGKGTARANPLLKDVPADAVAKYEKGMEKLGKNDAKGAIADFDAAIAAYPNFAAAHYEKGAALLKTSDYDKALESFVKAIQAKPDYVEAKYSVGYTQYLKKNYEVAAAVFDDVLKAKKDMPEANMYLGISLYNLKNIDAAEASLKKTIAAAGGDKLALAHLYLGQIYAQKKKNAEAVVELEKYLELVPKAPNAEKIKSVVADLKKKA